MAPQSSTSQTSAVARAARTTSPQISRRKAHTPTAHPHRARSRRRRTSRRRSASRRLEAVCSEFQSRRLTRMAATITHPKALMLRTTINTEARGIPTPPTHKASAGRSSTTPRIPSINLRLPTTISKIRTGRTIRTCTKASQGGQSVRRVQVRSDSAGRRLLSLLHSGSGIPHIPARLHSRSLLTP